MTLKTDSIKTDPPVGILKGWKLVSYVEITSDVSQMEISGLNGDTDIEYILTGRSISTADISTELSLRFNNDTGDNYNIHYHEVSSSDHTYGQYTSVSHMLIGRLPALGDLSFLVYIYAKSGGYRYAIVNSIGRDLWLGYYGNEWVNTTDEITSMQIYQVNGSIMAGSTFSLYKLKR